MKTLLCLLMGTGLLYGQFEYGEILGTVRDASQGVVAGAKVKLRNLDTNVEREASSNEQGDYSFPGIRGAFDKRDDLEARELVYKRLASGASSLSDITYTAWIESAKTPTKVDPLNPMENPKNPKYNPATGSAPAP
jgi:hypothetical protein